MEIVGELEGVRVSLTEEETEMELVPVTEEEGVSESEELGVSDNVMDSDSEGVVAL